MMIDPSVKTPILHRQRPVIASHFSLGGGADKVAGNSTSTSSSGLGVVETRLIAGGRHSSVSASVISALIEAELRSIIGAAQIWADLARSKEV